MNKRKVLRCILVVFTLVVLITAVAIYIVDTTGHRVKVGLAYLYEIRRDLNNYYKVHGDYPESYSIPKSLMKEKCLNSLEYKKKGVSNYEIMATVNNLIRKDVSLMASPEGVFVENRKRGGWQKWFESRTNQTLGSSNTGVRQLTIYRG